MLKKVLFLIITISAIAAIYSAETGNGYFRILKPLTTVLIILIPIFSGGKSNNKYKRLISAGLLFCLAGDVLLLKENLFVFGLASFLIGHIIFIISFLYVGGLKTFWSPLMILAPMATAMYFYISPDLGELKIPVLIYTVVICFMCWQGVNLFLWQRHTATAMIAIAVISFLISDSILAINKFSSPLPYAGILILSTYWFSIALLADSTTRRIRERETS